MYSALRQWSDGLWAFGIFVQDSPLLKALLKCMTVMVNGQLSPLSAEFGGVSSHPARGLVAFIGCLGLGLSCRTSRLRAGRTRRSGAAWRRCTERSAPSSMGGEGRKTPRMPSCRPSSFRTSRGGGGVLARTSVARQVSPGFFRARRRSPGARSASTGDAPALAAFCVEWLQRGPTRNTMNGPSRAGIRAPGRERHWSGLVQCGHNDSDPEVARTRGNGIRSGSVRLPAIDVGEHLAEDSGEGGG